MAKKTVGFNRTGIEKVPDDKPALYIIKTEGGKPNYAGVAERGRVQDRLREHLPGGKDFVPGVKVQITQMGSISEARKAKEKIIASKQPKYNTQGK
jgi:predicted GIY-YIG superfamily endonuclease